MLREERIPQFREREINETIPLCQQLSYFGSSMALGIECNVTVLGSAKPYASVRPRYRFKQRKEIFVV